MMQVKGDGIIEIDDGTIEIGGTRTRVILRVCDAHKVARCEILLSPDKCARITQAIIGVLVGNPLAEMSGLPVTFLIAADTPEAPRVTP